MEEGNIWDRVFLSSLLLIGLFILTKRNVKWSDLFMHNLPLILLIAFLLMSTLWSEMPFITLKRWIREIFVPIVMATVVSTEINPRQALISIFRRIIYVHISLSILLINYYPLLGRQYGRWSGELMWIGTATQKNGLALVCAFAIFFLIWTFIRRRHGFDTTVSWYQKYIEIFIIFLSIYLFMGPEHNITYSATAFVCLILGIIMLLCLVLLKRFNIILRANLLSVIIILLVLYGTVTPFFGGLTVFDLSEFFNRESTLTGRSVVWAKLLPYAMQNTFLGCGFSSFWNDELRATIDANAHNGYLDNILTVGTVGLFFWTIFLIFIIRKAQREMTRDADWGNFLFCITLMAVVHNISESSMTNFRSIFPTVVLFLSVSFSRYNSSEKFSRKA